ncbi:MAG: acyl-CoA synthetase [Burkholderiaceae bacterium]
MSELMRETTAGMFDDDLPQLEANFAALTPVSLVYWAADVYPDRLAVVHGELRLTWSEVARRAQSLATALQQMGIGAGDTVAVMLPNTPAMVDAHYGVPMLGAVLNSINTRLDAATIAFILDHSEARVLIADAEFAEPVEAALEQMRKNGQPLPLVIDVLDPVFVKGASAEVKRVGEHDFDHVLERGAQALDTQSASGIPTPNDPTLSGPDHEWRALALNYTSGTTGNPKGVVVHHRGAYLNAVGNIVAWNLPRHPVYLWTLPMFHCNGWCFPWTIAAVAGTHVCLRKVDPALIFELIRAHRVTHYCGAPVVHAGLINAPSDLSAGIDWTVKAMVAGASPPASMIEGMDRLGFDVTHVYGLTEVYGPAAVCAKQPDWAQLPLGEQAQRNARQGVRYQVQQSMTVLDPETLKPVPADGNTMGEVVFRGNITMKGYLKNPSATAEAFAGGWFHTGDLGVIDPDGYVKLKDRAKDIIISGGENISSIEVEDVLYRHEAVLACAVVAKPDDKWGETPLAFVELKAGATVDAQALIDHCRGALAGFKCPKEVRFLELPKTSTGKIQKHVLRKQIDSAGAIDG